MGTTGSLSAATSAKLLFVAAVTCYLLGRIFAVPAATVETVVYGGTAAVGLEFLLAAWGELWPRR